MKTKTLSRKAGAWKNELTHRVRSHQGSDDTASLAWEIVGGLVALFALGFLIRMLPEMVRYLKIERM